MSHFLVQYSATNGTDQPSLPLPCVLARIACTGNAEAATFIEPPSSEVEDLATEIADWAARFGYPTTRSTRAESIHETGATISVYLAPELKAGSPGRIAWGRLAAWMMLMDDIMDGVVDNQAHAPQNTYGNVSRDLRVFVDVLDGVLLPESAPHSTLNHFELLVAMLRGIYKSLVESIAGYQDRKVRKHFIKVIHKWLHSLLWRYQRPPSEPANVESYMFFRRYHGGSFVFFEIIALLHNIKWSELTVKRNDLDVRRWRSAYATCISLTNDVVSLRKELAGGESENLAIQLAVLEGVHIQKAMENCVRRLNSEIGELRVYTQRLVDRFPEDVKLRELIRLTNLSVDGHLYWPGYTKRYGKLERQVLEVSSEEYASILRPGKVGIWDANGNKNLTQL